VSDRKHQIFRLFDFFRGRSYIQTSFWL